MKANAYGRYGKISNGVLRKVSKRKEHWKNAHAINLLPLVFLRHLASYFYGYDAVSFGEVSSMVVMDSNQNFWKNIGNIRYRTRKMGIGQTYPRDGYYLVLPDQFIQLDSDRIYNRFIYDGFLSERLLSLMNTCQTDAFQTYARLQSYSFHEGACNLPILSFFEYSFMYANRCLNPIERKLFCVCRYGSLQEGDIVVNDIKMFERNLDDRFGFSHIKGLINFSLFILAGGAALNCLLIDDFNDSAQDLDFFWIGGGCYSSFSNAIDRFKRKISPFILKEKNMYGKVVEFILLLDNRKRIRIQFIFPRSDTNIPFILYTFDLDVVQVAYDGHRIISTIGFFQAISTKSFLCYNLTNNIFDTPIYLDRCLKYNSRGFTWLCPIGYKQALAQKPLIRAKRMVDYAFNDFYFNTDSFNIQLSFLQLNPF